MYINFTIITIRSFYRKLSSCYLFPRLICQYAFCLILKNDFGRLAINMVSFLHRHPLLDYQQDTHQNY